VVQGTGSNKLDNITSLSMNSDKGSNSGPSRDRLLPGHNIANSTNIRTVSPDYPPINDIITDPKVIRD